MKKTLLIILMLAVAGALTWFFYREPSVEEGSPKTFHGLSMSLPPGYELSERMDGYRGSDVDVLLLLPADAIVPDASEGPPGIALLGIATTTDDLASWVRTNSISNFGLSPDGALVPTTVGGDPALSYRYSGLYENDAVALAHEGYVYLFFGSWITADDQIRTDFQKLIREVQFVQ